MENQVEEGKTEMISKAVCASEVLKRIQNYKKGLIAGIIVCFISATEIYRAIISIPILVFLLYNFISVAKEEKYLKEKYKL